MTLTIEWLGHCAFCLRGNDFPTILIDPFDETIGYHVPPYDCEILLISHDHYDSSAKYLVPPGYELVSEKGTTLSHGIAFNAFPCWHDDRQGKDYGSVLIYLFELDGLKIGYLSHIGMVPPQWLLDKIDKLDICFVPVGDSFTIGPGDARYLVGRINPRIVIPMHFNTKFLNFTLLPVTEFLKGMPEVYEVKDWRFEINRDELPESTTVILMRHWPGVTP